MLRLSFSVGAPSGRPALYLVIYIDVRAACQTMCFVQGIRQNSVVPVWFHVVPTVRIFMEKFVWLKQNAEILAWFLRGSTWFPQRLTNTNVDFPLAKRSLLAWFLLGSMWFL